MRLSSAIWPLEDMAAALDMPDMPDSWAILANLPAPVILFGQDNRVIYANEACEIFLGRAKRRIEGEMITDILRFRSVRLNDALTKGSDDIIAQDMTLLIDGQAHNVDINFSAFTMAGQQHRLVMLTPRNGGHGYISDRSDDGVQQAVGAPAILSHEIKNPLAGIRGAAQLLAKSGGGEKNPLTDLIVNEVDRIARLLDLMQDLGGTQPREGNAQNIHLLIEKAIRSIRAANDVLPNISISYDPSLPHVLIQSDGMVQILINLLQNAIDAVAGVEDAEIGVTTRYVMSGALHEASADNRDGTTWKLPVEVTISDNGPGVPDHIANELFSPFVTTKRDGQGLGLAIVRKLAQQMRSRILYDRNEIQGLSQFKLYLPVALKQEQVS